MTRLLSVLLAALAVLSPAVAASDARGLPMDEGECCCCGPEMLQAVTSPSLESSTSCGCSKSPVSPPHRDVPAPLPQSAPSIDLAAAQSTLVGVLPELSLVRTAPRPANLGTAPPVRERLGVWLL